MSNITAKIKTGWLKCMETIGQGAANMADNAKQKLGELNMENRRKDLQAELPKKVMQLWKDGVELPEELSGLLAELNTLEEELAAARAARLAKKMKPAITDGSDSQGVAYILLQDYAPCEQEVARMLLEQGIEQYEAVPIEQQNWNAEWESGFEPVEVTGERPIRIRAPHHSPAEEGVMDVVIAPRMSFGTGHHATTALMSQTIASEGVEGLRGLDMGCGTGVLAIVALKCGAEHMVAVDIDDWACHSCRDSIALSGVAERVDVRCGSIEQVVAGEQFDFILANINRNILISMMPSFAAALPSGGRLFLIGKNVHYLYIMTFFAQLVKLFTVENIIEREGWMVVVCKKM